MGIYFAIGALLSFTLLNLLQRKFSVDSKNPRALSVAFNTSAIIFVLLVFLFSKSYKEINFPDNSSQIITLSIAVLMYGLFERGSFYVAQKLDASMMAIISNLGNVIAFGLSLFIYKESLTLTKFFGVTFVFIALFLVSYEKKLKERDKSSLKYKFLAVLIFVMIGIAWSLDKKGTTDFGANSYTLFVWVLPLIFVVFPYIKVKDVLAEFKTLSWRILFLAALNVCGYFLLLKSLEKSEATVVLPIVQLNVLATVFAGVLFFKEKEMLGQKIIAGVLSLFGAYLILL